MLHDFKFVKDLVTATCIKCSLEVNLSVTVAGTRFLLKRQNPTKIITQEFYFEDVTDEFCPNNLDVSSQRLKPETKN
jgi:hypothetical protein